MTWFLTHLATVVGSLLSILAIAEMLRQRRSPSSTAAWLLAIVAVPYVGVPLFLMFGGHQYRRLIEAVVAPRFHRPELDCAVRGRPHLHGDAVRRSSARSRVRGVL